MKKNRKYKKIKIIMVFTTVLLMAFVAVVGLYKTGIYRFDFFKDVYKKIDFQLSTNELNIPQDALSFSVYDIEQGEYLFYEGDSQLPTVASLAKLFVIDYALTKVNLEDVIEVNQEVLDLVPAGSSLANLKVGKYTVKEIMEAMLVPSGNDAAYSLAYYIAKNELGEGYTATEYINYFTTELSEYLIEEGYSKTNLYNDPSGASMSADTHLDDINRVALKLYNYDFVKECVGKSTFSRSVEDIDEVALSYAEIKALAVGNPYIKEKMDLDIQVSKLQLLKQSFLSQKYEMEDKAVRYFPNEIKQCEQRIADYESDIALAKENTPPDRETFPGMQIHDVVYTEKKEAGQAIIEACKAMKSAEAVLIGRYRGFPMKLSYDSFQKVFVISMYGKQVYHVPLGTDIHGNITRLDNKIQEIPDKMLRCQDKLENLKVQLENAKEEAQKEFPQEAELAEKVASLGELNVLLDMDKKDQVLLDDGEGVEIEPEQKKNERER